MIMKITPPKVGNKTLTDRLKEKHAQSKKKFVKDASEHKPLGSISSPTENDQQHQKQYPWKEASVRKDMVKLFNLRLSEPDWLKLKYIADNSGNSMHNICLDIIIPAIHRRIKKLTGQNIV